MRCDLPRGWVWATVADISDVQLGRQRSPQHHAGEQMRPYLRAANVTWQGICLNDVNEMNFDDVDFEKHRLSSGDILLNEASGSPHEVGKPAIWNNEIEGCCFQNTLLRLRPQFLNRDYLYWYCYASAFTGRFGEAGRGVNIRHLGKRGLSQFPIPVAPLAEQERIVAAIEERFSRLDAVESTLRKVVKRLHTLRATILVEGFHSNRGLPSHWNRATIGEVAEVRGGIQKQPKRRPNKNPAPFLRVANVLRGELLLDEVHHIELFDGELERYRLQAGDLLVVEGNGSPQQIGRAASWVDEIADCVHQNHLIRVRPGPSLDPGYLALYWNAPHTASVLRDVASSTSGLYTLSTAKVKSIPIPLAPLPEQRRIAEEVDQQLEKHSRLEQSIRHALDRLRAVRRSVLAVAFSGQLVPQDPSDEPASVLLERIAASRMTKPKRQRVDA